MSEQTPTTYPFPTEEAPLNDYCGNLMTELRRDERIRTGALEAPKGIRFCPSCLARQEYCTCGTDDQKELVDRATALALIKELVAKHRQQLSEATGYLYQHYHRHPVVNGSMSHISGREGKRKDLPVDPENPDRPTPRLQKKDEPTTNDDPKPSKPSKPAKPAGEGEEGDEEGAIIVKIGDKEHSFESPKKARKWLRDNNRSVRDATKEGNVWRFDK